MKRLIRKLNLISTISIWWQVYGLGQLGELEGKIYTDWKIIDEIPHEARLERDGMDFGYSVDPTVIVAIYKYNDGFIMDEIAYQKGLNQINQSPIYFSISPSTSDRRQC